MGFAARAGGVAAYRPTNEQDAHHLIGMFALPWNVIVPAMVLAVLATLFAASLPARAITRLPVVGALAGRPAPPRQIHRSLVPGLVALGLGFLFFSLSGAAGHGSGVIWLIPGLIALVTGIILVSPFFLVLLARVGGKAPVAVRLPLRDMARYRGRSGSALSAISLGVMIAVIVCAVAVARYTNAVRLRRAEPGGRHAQRVQPPRPARRSAPTGSSPSPSAGERRRPSRPQEAAVHAIASAVGATSVVGLGELPWRTCRAPVRPAGNGTARSTWRRRRCCGPTASTRRPSLPTWMS